METKDNPGLYESHKHKYVAGMVAARSVDWFEIPGEDVVRTSTQLTLVDVQNSAKTLLIILTI